MLAIILVLSRPASALTLDEAWAASDTNNLELQLAQESAVQQGTLRGKAWSALQPRLTLNASYVINNTEIALDFSKGVEPELAALFPPALLEPIVVQEKTFWQGDVTLAQRLFSGSALPLLRSAYQLNAAAQDDVRAAEMSAKAQVATAYYGLLTAEQAVGVARKGVDLAQAQLSLAQRMREAGMADVRATVQAQLGVSRAERDVRSAEEQLLSARTGFELLTGIEGRNLELPEPFPIPSDVAASVAAARTHRPDLLAARHRTRALALARNANHWRWAPVIDGVGTYSYSENLGFNDTNWNWRVVFAASWDLWDGGLRLAETREATSRMRSAEIGESLAERNAEREIEVAFESHGRAEAALQAVGAELELAQESLRLAEASYTAGGATWLEVEQARLLLQATELSGLRERMTRDLAAIDLLVRTGEL